jgi:hypothetical protein
MRNNLIGMLDHVGLHSLLENDSCARLATQISVVKSIARWRGRHSDWRDNFSPVFRQTLAEII